MSSIARNILAMLITSVLKSIKRGNSNFPGMTGDWSCNRPLVIFVTSRK